MPVKFVMRLWQDGKLSHRACVTDLLACREPASLRLVELIQGYEAQELADLIHRQSRAVILEVFARHARFRRHATVSAFLDQVDRAKHWGKKDRASCLLLAGESGRGKTSYAIALVGGPEKAMVVNCQGLGCHLPSVAEYHKKGYEGVVWDEISREQVLANKKVFQACIYPMELGQSVCNQHAYMIWPYLMKNVLCSNKFHIDSSQDASLEPEDEDWLKHNVMQAHLPKGKMWYLREDEQDMLLSQAEADEAAHQQLLAAAGA